MRSSVKGKLLSADLLIDPEFLADSHDLEGKHQDRIPHPEDEEYGTNDENQETVHNQGTGRRTKRRD